MRNIITNLVYRLHASFQKSPVKTVVLCAIGDFIIYGTIAIVLYKIFF